MFITEMIFTNKQYHRQVDVVACLEACKAVSYTHLTLPTT